MSFVYIASRARYLIFAAVLAICCMFSTAIYSEENKPPEKDYCVDCHSKQSGSPAESFSQWKSSAHNRPEISCVSCHGGNPLLNDKRKSKSRVYAYNPKPGGKNISGSCGRDGCHSDEFGYLKSGPHLSPVMKTGQPDCVSCHGSHSIGPASTDMLNEKNCGSCHSEEQYRETLDWIKDSSGRISMLKERIGKLEKRLSDTVDLKNRVDQTGKLLHMLIHSFSPEDMNFTKRIIDLELKTIDSETESSLVHSTRLDILYILMLSVTMSLVLGIAIYTMVMYMKRKH